MNGTTVRTPDHWVDLDRDQVTFDSKPVRESEKLYLLLYKPKGFITSYKDPEGRPTVYDLINDAGEWVFPVGRLDQDTSGLLLMTNDTAFGEKVTNPEHKVPKTYLVKASRILDESDLQRLRDGIALADGPTRPADVRWIRNSEKYTHFEITISEGRNRQVRRMVEALDAVVLKLVRTSIGPLALGSLQIGKWRWLTPKEALGILPRA